MKSPWSTTVVAVDHDRPEQQPVGALRAGREWPHDFEPEPVGGLHGRQRGPITADTTASGSSP